MSTRVPSLTVKNLSNVLVEVLNWPQLGANLDLKMYKLKEIEKNKMGDIAGGRLAFIDLWLRTDVNASWEKLITALEMIGGYETTIERIREEFLHPGAGARGSAQVQSRLGGGVPGGRVAADGGVSPVQVAGIRQPVVGRELPPEEEIRHAQRMIDNPDEDNPQGRVVQLVNLLSNSRFDIDYRNPNDNDNTLLHHSCVKGDLDVVRALVAFGANVNQLNKYGQTPLDAAQFLHKEDVLKFLKEVGGMAGNALGLANSPPVPVQSPIQEQGHQMEDEDGPRDEGMLFGGHLILTLDYSSTMALVQLEVLSQLEKATGRKIVDIFEWIVASGVSGFLVLAMVYARKTVSELRRIYFRLRERVFSGQAPEERGKELEELAIEIFTPTRRMLDDADQELGPKILIGAVNKSSTNLEPVFFNNYDEEHSRMHVWKVARYTCSSPLYVGECDNFIDGGAVYKNPSIFAFSAIREAYRLQSICLSGVLSIGDGRMPGVALGKLDKTSFYTHFYSSSANTLSEQISRSFAAICEAGGMRYQRINPLMDEYLTVPEEASLEQLVNAVIRTIAQGQGEDSDVRHFSRSYNNIVVR